jgi:steroid 5-alpha reductase family enzyme
MTYYLTLGFVLWAYVSLWFVIAVLKRRNDVADVAWGLGFVLLAWASFFLSGAAAARGILVSTLVSVWGLRLAWHISRRHRGKAEDYRYAAWRREWGKWFYVRSYLQVFLLQGAFLFLTAMPVLIINASARGKLGFLGGIGVSVWLFGFLIETAGDAQLASFVKNPLNRGRIMQSGLWRYSRHPNYFGEIVQWWGIWVVALGAAGGWFGVVGPLTITILIVRVSGIPMLERKMAENPDFADYKRRTSALIPLLPKS